MTQPYADPPAGWDWPAPARDAVSPRPEPRRPGPTALAVLAVAVAVALLGVPFGLVWAAIAPDVPVIVTDAGPVYARPQPEQPIAADGWFAILALPVGAIAAFGVWFAARRLRGALALAALLAGSVGTGLVAWWLGRRIGLADYQATLAAAGSGARLDRPADLEIVAIDWWPPQVLGVLLVPALAAAAVYTLLAAWSRFPDLRPANANAAADQDRNPDAHPDPDAAAVAAHPGDPPTPMAQ